MQPSRTPLILLVVALSLCIALSCIAAAGGVLLYRILGMPQRSDTLRVAGTTSPTGEDAGAEDPQRAAAVNRLLVVGDDGNIYTVRPDGTDRVPLTTDASVTHLYQQPAWSPDAATIAWAEVLDVEASVPSTSVVFAGPDGTDISRVPMGGFAPFYLAWSPDGRRLACLSNWSSGLALRTVEPAQPAAAPRLIGEGQPFYFSWAPDGSRLLAHISGKQLALFSALGEQTPLDPQPGIFSAPQWSDDGEHLVFVERQGSEQRVDGTRLVQADPQGVVQRELAGVEGALTFALSPGGDHIAFVDTTVEIAMAAFGPLHIVDVESGRDELVDEGPVLAFYWSPDGRKLAYLTVGQDPRAPGEGPRASAAPEAAASHLDLWLKWRVWDGMESADLALFSPADTYLFDYLRFFDQFARSATPWSPDSAAFTFAGVTEEGGQGIWVQEARPEGELRRVGDGVYSAWSPR